MLEFAREWLSAGVGASTFARALSVPSSRQVTGIRVTKEVCKLKPEESQAKFIPLVDIPHLLAEAERELLSLSPHPDDKSIAAIAVQKLAGLPIELIRTLGRQRSVDDDDLTAIAEKERAKGEAAAGIANKLGRSISELTGEQYVAELRGSPDAPLTRTAIKSIRKSTPAVALGPGVSLSQGVADFPYEIPCSDTQKLSVRISRVDPKQRTAIAWVVDPGEHAAFWEYFDDREFEIEILDETRELTMHLACAFQVTLEVEINATVFLPRGQLKHDRVRGGLCGELDHSAVAAAAVRQLTQQLKLGL
jgi:hypothetical protein